MTYALDPPPTTPIRSRLSNRRGSEIFDVQCGGLKFTVTVSRFAGGNPAEIFLNCHKADSGAAAAAMDAAVVASISLQYGVPLEVIRRALLRNSRGEPSTALGVALDAIGKPVP